VLGWPRAKRPPAKAHLAAAFLHHHPTAVSAGGAPVVVFPQSHGSHGLSARDRSALHGT